jgi:hypothetical protein
VSDHGHCTELVNGRSKLHTVCCGNASTWRCSACRCASTIVDPSPGRAQATYVHFPLLTTLHNIFKDHAILMHLCSMLSGASASPQLTAVLLAGAGAIGLLRVLASGRRLTGICKVPQSHSNHARYVQSSAQAQCMHQAPTEAPGEVWQHRQSTNWPSRALGSSVAASRCLSGTPWGVGLQACSSSSRGLSATTSAADDSDPADVPRRRRRSATESNAAMRRTTVSKPAQDDQTVAYTLISESSV